MVAVPQDLCVLTDRGGDGDDGYWGNALCCSAGVRHCLWFASHGHSDRSNSDSTVEETLLRLALLPGAESVYSNTFKTAK